MGRIVLVTGGCRSGKSGYAQRRIEEVDGARLFIATAEPYDDEMRHRIARHRADRADRGWDTLDAPYALAESITKGEGYAGVLVDCLTLWVGNRFFGGVSGELPTDATEEKAREEAERLQAAARRLPPSSLVVFVTNEVGWGIVPENAMARRFRDLAGHVNQTVAAGADEVFLLVCGQPLKLKG